VKLSTVSWFDGRLLTMKIEMSRQTILIDEMKASYYETMIAFHLLGQILSTI
jgi:hypothetical protein